VAAQPKARVVLDLSNTGIAASSSTGGRNIGGVSKSFRTGRLERELQMVQLSAIRCSCIDVL
jgi:hypothetical protein